MAVGVAVGVVDGVGVGVDPPPQGAPSQTRGSWEESGSPVKPQGLFWGVVYPAAVMAAATVGPLALPL